MNMTKNELAKKIKENLKKVFGNTMKFSVTSTYIVGTPNITIQIKEAHNDYFKTFEDYKKEKEYIIAFYGLDAYEQILLQYKDNRLSSLTEEVINTINSLGNEFNNTTGNPFADDYKKDYYLTISDGGKSITKIY